MRILLPYFLVLLFAIPLVAQETYTVGRTEYYHGRTYSTTGKAMVKRSDANRADFLRSRGYTEVPYGYEVDHMIPLHLGGTDEPSNMQLLTKEQHARKTAAERARVAFTTSAYRPSSYRSTYSSSPNYATPPKTYLNKSSYPTSSYPSANRTVHTGSRGGQYYINKNGNKTYIKRK